MSISAIGNSDPYERYRQQQIDLLAPPSPASAQSASTASTPSVAPTASSDPTSAGTFATKFKADLTSLNSQGGPAGAHGHHHHHGGGALSSNSTTTDLTDPSTDPTSNTSTSGTDPFSAALDDFANLVSESTDTTAA